VVHQIQRELPDVVLKTYGAQESDVDLFIATRRRPGVAIGIGGFNDDDDQVG